MKGKFTVNEFRTIDSGEASFLIFKGFDFELDATDPSQVTIVFAGGDDGVRLPMLSQLKADWWTRDDYRRFLRVYQDLIRSIKAVQMLKKKK